MSIETTLAERETRYGTFDGHARLSQLLTDAIRSAPKFCKMGDMHKEALEMIAHKIARILNGDPDYADNWHDIAGYAALVEQAITPQQETDVMSIAGFRLCSHRNTVEQVCQPQHVRIGVACPICHATT